MILQAYAILSGNVRVRSVPLMLLSLVYLSKVVHFWWRRSTPISKSFSRFMSCYDNRKYGQHWLEGVGHTAFLVFSGYLYVVGNN